MALAAVAFRRRQAKIVDDPPASNLSIAWDKPGAQFRRQGSVLSGSPSAIVSTFPAARGLFSLIKIADEEDELARWHMRLCGHAGATPRLSRVAAKSTSAMGSITPACCRSGGYAAALFGELPNPYDVSQLHAPRRIRGRHLGVQYMWAAGHDPHGSVSIFRKWNRCGGPSPWSPNFSPPTLMDPDRIAPNREGDRRHSCPPSRNTSSPHPATKTCAIAC